jgi:hypothetical protein
MAIHKRLCLVLLVLLAVARCTLGALPIKLPGPLELPQKLQRLEESFETDTFKASVDAEANSDIAGGAAGSPIRYDIEQGDQRDSKYSDKQRLTPEQWQVVLKRFPKLAKFDAQLEARAAQLKQTPLTRRHTISATTKEAESGGNKPALRRQNTSPARLASSDKPTTASKTTTTAAKQPSKNTSPSQRPASAPARTSTQQPSAQKPNVQPSPKPNVNVNVVPKVQKKSMPGYMRPTISSINKMTTKFVPNQRFRLNARQAAPRSGNG